MPLHIIRQDITQMHVDAIVNTTNTDMVGYSGVDLAVHTAAGDELETECARIAPLGIGEVKITSGYRLHCKYVIHTVGPVWQGGLQGEKILLRSCYTEALNAASELGCESVAFPLISSGAYNYPKDRVLKYAVQIISEFLFDNELTVYLCVFDKESYSFSKKLYKDISGFIDGNYLPGERLASSRSSARSFSSADHKLRGMALYKEEEKCCSEQIPSVEGKTLDEYLINLDISFRDYLFKLIDESGMTDVECYKRANVDKRTFSKIKNNKNYRPSKQTVVAFAIALSLDMEQTQALLATVGFTLSGSSVFDKIICYFILNGIYDVFEINEALFEFDQLLLGSF